MRSLNALVLKMEVPGMDAKNIQVSPREARIGG
jgi:hypothetical protein